MLRARFRVKILKDLGVSDIVCCKYARPVSRVVERTFSQYKSLFRDNWRTFTVRNLRMTLVVYRSSPSLSVLGTAHFWSVQCVTMGTLKIILTFGAYFLI
jgi:hypothetical protein